MLDAAFKALSDMFSPSFRKVLLKAIGLALLMIVLIGIGLQRLSSWLADSGGNWAEGAIGQDPYNIVKVAEWIITILSTFGIVLGAIFLMPAVTAFVGSFFVDEIAEEVERKHYPAEPIGSALPAGRAVFEGSKTGLLSVGVYIIALPFVLFAGFGFLILYFATAWLLGREYFELAAMRYRSPAEAKAFRKANGGTVFFAGMLLAAFVSIPIVNLAAPLFGAALMVHLHKRLSGGRAELLERGDVSPRLR